MWLWQLKNIHKRHLLWLKFFSVCLFAHLTFLSWVFFIDHDPSHTISVSLNKHMDYSAPILFVPAFAKASNSAKATSDRSADTAIQSTVVAATKKTTTPNKPTATVQPAKKISPPTTTLTAAKQTPAKKVTPATTVPTTITPKVATPVKKEAIKKTVPEQQKITPEKSASPITQATDPATLRQAQGERGGDEPTNKEKPKEKPQSSSQSQRIIPENAHISDDYREVEAMRRTALLQKELLNNWKPPVGMPASAACEISFTVNKNGTITTTTMAKSSGIVMYDLSARHALFAMKMPQWTHGKTLTINFKQ